VNVENASTIKGGHGVIVMNLKTTICLKHKKRCSMVKKCKEAEYGKDHTQV